MAIKKNISHYRIIVFVIMWIQIIIIPHAIAEALSIWLIPLHAQTSNEISDSALLQQWDKEFGAGNIVICENLANQFLRDQLIVNNPEIGEPNLSLIVKQRPVLELMKQFARNNHITVRVRFLMWNRLFEEIHQAIADHSTPDIIEIGSTWVQYFAQNHFLHENTGQNLKFHTVRDIPGTNCISIPYSTDIRVLFYWKKYPHKKRSGPLVIQSKNWNTIIQSMKDYNQELKNQNINNMPPLVFPIGLTLNLVHDFIPLIWANNSTFLNPITSKVMLNQNNLTVPLMLANNSSVIDQKGIPHLLIAFPEISHNEACRQFIRGGYSAIIEPILFIKNWYHNFIFESESFWEYAGAVAPPTPFKGGSDLVVMSHTTMPSMAFQLIHKLCFDLELQEKSVHFGRILPQASDFGLSYLKEDLPQGADQFIQEITKALTIGKEYPLFAKWASCVENRETLELFQNVWRRMGQGNSDQKVETRIIHAAEKLEHAINLKINLVTKIKFFIKNYWHYCVFPLLTIVFLFILKQKEKIRFIEKIQLLEEIKMQNNRKIIAMMLLRGKFHSTLGYQGARIIDFSALPCDDLKSVLEEYGSTIALNYNKHWMQIIHAVHKEIENVHKPLAVEKVINIAFQGATTEYYINFGKKISEIGLIFRNTSHWIVPQFNTVLVVVLQEWFYNSLKHIHHTAHGNFTIVIEEKQLSQELQIISPQNSQKSLDPVYVNTLVAQRPSDSSAFSDTKGGQGLNIIRDLLWYSFETVARLASVYPSGNTILFLDIQLKSTH
jgi:hypothetical protein